jgi:hypothetical protein
VLASFKRQHPADQEEALGFVALREEVRRSIAAAITASMKAAT